MRSLLWREREGRGDRAVGKNVGEGGERRFEDASGGTDGIGKDGTGHAARALGVELDGLQ